MRPLDRRSRRARTAGRGAQLLLQVVRGRLTPRDLDCLEAASREVSPEAYDPILARVRQRLREDRYGPASRPTSRC